MELCTFTEKAATKRLQEGRFLAMTCSSIKPSRHTTMLSIYTASTAMVARAPALKRYALPLCAIDPTECQR